MIDIPKPMPLSQLLTYSSELFTPYELSLQDYLINEILQNFDLDEHEMVLVVNLDPEKPVKEIEGENIVLNFAGSFYPPKREKNGAAINLEIKDWVATITELLDREGLNYEMIEGEPIKFQITVPALTLPSSEEPEKEKPKKAKPEKEEPAEDEETAPKAEKPVPEEPEEEPAEQAEDQEEDKEMSKEDFEKAFETEEEEEPKE